MPREMFVPAREQCDYINYELRRDTVALLLFMRRFNFMLSRAF